MTTKKPSNVTLKSEKALHNVFMDDGSIVAVEAASVEEAIKKAEAKEQSE